MNKWKINLVESFKCTLEEVQDADLVLHIRDISHPNSEDQKDTVMKVLQELDFNESFYKKKMVLIIHSTNTKFIILFLH